ncbi:uncharacterized protein UV8b_07311 [Ustilaginoidea virens]|uniref:Amidohydrolase 3 domain-containing protein n=1 Tax=Ustilaginoidea virens TaxID=1159556 RepID=A0A8E5HX81_USTVR|nr:uncharacterized protein UV8b_07311 [Ustilaginoidea virens]QUC23070.1 hypothetical protein UV8b_07311 [Ustilaginoidea virens]
MPSSPPLRWGALLSVATAIVFAFVLNAHQGPSGPGSGDAAVYCYAGVRTLDRNRPAANCFSVANGVFTRVWRDAAIAHDDARSSDARSNDGEHPTQHDGHVIPGLWDGHGHLMAWGEFLHSVDLFDAQDLSEVRKRLASYLKDNPDAGKKDNWLRGAGWDQDLYGRMPTAGDLELDPALKGAHVMLDRNDGHCIWVSKAVLDMLPGNMTDVPGGQIIRDPGPGVFCDAAMGPVTDLWPPATKKTRTTFVRDAMRDLNRVGLVGVHDASTPPAEVQLYSELADTDDWTVRVYGMLECSDQNQYCPGSATKIARDDGRFWVQSVKLFADGALGSWGSALLEPYADRKDKTGTLLINATALTDLAKLWAQAGFQVNVHAIGDRANRQVVDAFVAALRHVCPGATTDRGLRACQARRRFRIEHAQIVHPDDQARMHRVGLIPSLQPTHATDDMRFALARLGARRTRHSAYRMRSYLDLLPILGSDFPVEPPNPLHGIYAAVTRKSPRTGLGLANSTLGWHADEALTLDQAVWGFTGAPARGAFLEHRAGVIKPGAFADWLVLDEPLERVDIEDLRTLTVRETWVAGKRVYSRRRQEEEEEKRKKAARQP